MTVTINGAQRSVQVEVAVPGIANAVWRAIATGPGISSWFVPAAFDKEEGQPATVEFNFGPGMQVRSAITAWDPPRAFTVQGEGWGGSPPIATQWSVAPGDDGSCVVRVVNSLIADDAQWDGHLEATALGWPAFFRTLRLYLTHFPGQASALLQRVAPVPGTAAQAWAALMAALGVDGVRIGQPWTAPPSAPVLQGVVEYVSDAPYDLVLRFDQPGPGVAAFGVFGFGGQSMVALNFYHYGDGARETVALASPAWEAWMQAHFPAPEGA